MVVLGITIFIPLVTFVIVFLALQRFTVWFVHFASKSYSNVNTYQTLKRQVLHAEPEHATNNGLETAVRQRSRLVSQPSATTRTNDPRCCCCAAPRLWCRRAQRWVRFNLPAPFDTSEALVAYLLRSQRNSLRSFLRAPCRTPAH